MLNFVFLEKDLRIVFSPHFVLDFSRKMFLMLYCIATTDQISFSDCLYFLRYWAVCVLKLALSSLSLHNQKVKTKFKIS